MGAPPIPPAVMAADALAWQRGSYDYEGMTATQLSQIDALNDGNVADENSLAGAMADTGRMAVLPVNSLQSAADAASKIDPSSTAATQNAVHDNVAVAAGIMQVITGHQTTANESLTNLTGQNVTSAAESVEQTQSTLQGLENAGNFGVNVPSQYIDAQQQQLAAEQEQEQAAREAESGGSGS